MSLEFQDDVLDSVANTLGRTGDFDVEVPHADGAKVSLALRNVTALMALHALAVNQGRIVSPVAGNGDRPRYLLRKP